MNVINIGQIITAVLLIGAVMLQNRGTDSGIAMGGGSQSYRSKKGLEKFLFYLTIALAAIFACLSILSVVV